LIFSINVKKLQLHQIIYHQIDNCVKLIYQSGKKILTSEKQKQKIKWVGVG